THRGCPRSGRARTPEAGPRCRLACPREGLGAIVLRPKQRRVEVAPATLAVAADLRATELRHLFGVGRCGDHVDNAIAPFEHDSGRLVCRPVIDTHEIDRPTHVLSSAIPLPISSRMARRTLRPWRAAQSARQAFIEAPIGW